MNYLYFIFEVVKWFKKNKDQQERDNAIKRLKKQTFYFVLSNIFWLALVIIGLIAFRF